MKRIFIVIICITLLLVSAYKANDISNTLVNYITNNKVIIENKENNYTKNENYLYVKKIDNYIPYSYNDLLNIFYTIIDKGYENFTFYCPKEYKNCLNDLELISNDDLILTNINNYVHPFNSFTSINTTIYESGEINIKLSHLYSQEEIEIVNQKTDEIINNLVDKNKSNYENIKSIHDYIINNTKYDEYKNKDGETNHESTIATGVLVNHLATCNGYTDTMAIILTKMGIKNYKIATTPDDISYPSSGHVWNAVYLDGKWLHLDLTWDDPVASDGKDYLYHKYFLVTTKEMQEADSGEVNIEEHNFKKNIYLEYNELLDTLL